MAVAPYLSKIGDILLKHEAITEQALAQAEENARSRGIRLEKHLVDKDLVKGADMTLALSEYLHMPPINLAHFTPDSELLKILPKETMAKRMALPVTCLGRTLTVALGDPFDLMAMDEIGTITGMTVVPLVASQKQIDQSMARFFATTSQALDMEEVMREDSDVEVLGDAEEEISIDEMLESAEGAPVIRMVNMILVEALRTTASDIHIEPMEAKLRLRYRIDGELVEKPGPPKGLQAAVISRVKIMADLDIAERRIPQDGRFNIKALGREVDIRVSILPGVKGEKIVMRVLDKGALFPSLSALGLDDTSQQAMQYAIEQPHGIVLVTGPTGSGKTTTLYSCLQELNQPNVNLITCEDPVEYQLEGINQVQINTEVGLGFSEVLRSILRQDPDIILVGEIRDSETARIAIKAALTGHLVLSTLHTNDAPGAVSRLIDMGIEPFMLGSSLVLSQAQRLFRKLCPACKKPTELQPKILEMNRIDPAAFDGARVFKASGCPRCTSGYKGRAAIMEVLLLDDAIREAILRGDNTGEIRKIAVDNGMIPLKEVGLQQVREGVTTLEVALEVTGGE